jgi:cytochrome c oxidase assembly protein subunit 11
MSNDNIPESRVANSSGAEAQARADKRRNLPMMAKLAFFALIMFGFGWGMIPLYNAICEVTGINNLTQRDESAEAFAKSTQVDESRTVVIEFDSNIHGPWRFKPMVRSIDVHPGELATVEYELVNTVDQTKAGQAIPSYAPEIGGKYFRKLECFCFQQQTLEAHESRRFPVVFVIDPALPAEVTTITLSYTFFDIAGVVGKASGSSVGAAALAPLTAKGRT